MRCRRCDYPLWDLAVRVCPECGEAFRPSAYEFAPSSVRFCCPRCDQEYFGDDERGLLRPRSFACGKCGSAITLDEMIVRRLADVPEEATRAEVLPWLDRKERGRFRAWTAMIGLALFQPYRLMKAVPESGSPAQEWWFLVVTTVLVSIASVIPAMAVTMLPIFFALAPRMGGRPAMGGVFAGMTGVTLGFAIVATILFAVAWGALAHAILFVTGPTSAGIRRTYQAICYSAGADAATMVPCLGWWGIGMVWWIVSAVLMTQVGQRVSAWRAAVAIALPPVVATILFVSAYGVWVTTLMARAGAARAGQDAMVEARRLGDELRAYAGGRGGRWPEHVLELVPATTLGAGSFISLDGETSPDSVPAGDGTLREMQQAGPGRQSEMARTAARNLGAGVVAYRVGDFVLTYPGVDFASGDRGLWVAVLALDPTANAGLAAEAMCVAVDLGGRAQVIAPADLALRLNEQNALREAAGLPPLPNPTTITQAAPVRGEPAAPTPSGAP
jgi:hypothetical protein